MQHHLALLRKICLLLVVGFSATPAIAQDKAPMGRLLFLGVAYDEAPGEGQTVDNYNYAPDNFSTLLDAQSKDLFSVLKGDTLKGARATRPALADRLVALQRNARKNDLVFLYWGTHGGSDAKGWSANLPGDGVVRGTELKAELAKLPCPVVVAISTCGSGGFVHTRPNTTDLPANVVALCACQRKLSTTNELDISLLEALAGFGDFDADGRVTLGEALEYVPKRYRRLMKDSPDADTNAVLGHGNSVPLDRALTSPTGTHVAVVDDGVWRGATIIERLDGKTKVRFLGYDSVNPRGGFAYPDKVIPNDHIDFAGGHSPIEVESEGTWYPAVIVAVRDRGAKIHYVGYPDSNDEVVLPKRIRYPFVQPGERRGRGPRKE